MLIGLGHDLQSIDEIRAASALFEPGLFFTEAELARIAGAPNRQESAAALFCAKEALFKALSAVDGWFWTDAEVVRDARNAPRFRFHGALAAHMTERRALAALTLSHSGGFASAVVAITLN